MYLKDIQYTSDGRPVILFMTSGGFESGPKNDPRTFTTAEWTGDRVARVRDHERRQQLRFRVTVRRVETADGEIIGSTQPGPQAYNTGGEIAIWLSENGGGSWKC